MSVVTFPRRVEHRPPPARTTARHRSSTPSVIAGWRHRSLGVKLGIVAVSALLVVMAGSSYAAQRQVELHQQQTLLLQVQAKYAAQLTALANMAAPARVAALAGKYHLVVPSSVTPLPAVSLSVILPAPQLRGSQVVLPRILR